MPRQPRIEYEGAIYHVMNRGDRREDIVHGEADRRLFVQTLGETAVKCGWEVHAWCLMTNHFHLVVETPQGNLVAGMKWFLGTYTIRFNARHRLRGHLFSGRYKSVVIDDADFFGALPRLIWHEDEPIAWPSSTRQGGAYDRQHPTR